MKVFRRLSDAGHAAIFSSRMVAGNVVFEITNPHSLAKMTTTLSKEDAKRYAAWLLSKTERKHLKGK